jgi:hypothetical protein
MAGKKRWRKRGENEWKIPEFRNDEDFGPEAVRKLWRKLRKSWPKQICLHCANLVWPQPLDGDRPTAGGPVRYPICVDHADSPGVPREVHPAESCPNFRPKPQPALRVVPPKPERPNDRYIPLTRGLWAVVDVADFARLNQHRWYAAPSGNGQMYARRNTKNGTILMHREIVHAPPGMVVDHKDRNGLNNRPDNLRVCTPAQNEYNKAPRGKRSRFKGVYPDGNKWYSVIKHEGVTHYCGRFDDEVEAAKARDRKARELEGEYAYLNIPEEFQGQAPSQPTTPERENPTRRPRAGKSKQGHKKRKKK